MLLKDPSPLRLHRTFFSLARVGIGDLVASLQERHLGTDSVAVTAPPGDLAATVEVYSGPNKARTKVQIRSDLAAIARLRLRMFFSPGVFRELAKESLLAEGRAFERYDGPSVLRNYDQSGLSDEVRSLS